VYIIVVVIVVVVVVVVAMEIRSGYSCQPITSTVKSCNWDCVHAVN